MPGAQCTRSLVCAGGSKYAHQYSQRRRRIHPAFTTQWFYGLYVISPVTSSFLPPSPHELNGFTCPVGPTKPPQGLASATDARTTRLRRTLQRRSSSRREPLTIVSPCDHPCASTLPRPPHPTPTFVTIASRPSSRGGMVRTNHTFLKNRSDLFLLRGLDRNSRRAVICPSGSGLVERRVPK